MGVPPGLKMYILRDIAIHLLQRDTSQKNRQNPDREAALVAIFPILPLYFIVFHLKQKYYEDF